MLSAALLLPAPAKAVSADHAYVLDGVTGRVLFEKNAGERGLIASTTKIMTALVVCEQCNVLDRMRIPGEAVGIEGSCCPPAMTRRWRSPSTAAARWRALRN